MSDTISNLWIAIAVVLPMALGLAIAWPLWGRANDSLGSILGTLVVFAFGVAFVGRELVHLQQLTYRCIAMETVCRFYPLPFTRFFIYGIIAMAQAFVLFAAGAAVEERRRNRAYAAEWR